MTASDAPIRVVVADDSLVAREMLTQILDSDPQIDVVGQAADGAEAVDLVSRLRPDLVTMDIHMPRMDGLEAIGRIMAFTPTPILVVSSSVYGEGMGRAFDALDRGALEVIKKPEPKDWADLDRIGRELLRKVRILARVKVITHVSGRRERRAAGGISVAAAARVRSIVAIGSSTGGPSALHAVFAALPGDLPVPVLVAQHIAEGFIPGLVAWLDAGSAIKVVAAAEGTVPEPGTAYVAPTGANMVLSHDRIAFAEPSGGQLYIPSADALFESVGSATGESAIGAILTGMGADGARGLRALHDRGALTIAQDELTCTVFGMPKAAIELGGVDQVLPLASIGPAIAELCAP